MVITRNSNQHGSESYDKAFARPNQPRTSDVFVHELQFLLSGVLPVFQNLNYKLPGTEKKIV